MKSRGRGVRLSASGRCPWRIRRRRQDSNPLIGANEAACGGWAAEAELRHNFTVDAHDLAGNRRCLTWLVNTRSPRSASMTPRSPPEPSFAFRHRIDLTGELKAATIRSSSISARPEGSRCARGQPASCAVEGLCRRRRSLNTIRKVSAIAAGLSPDAIGDRRTPRRSSLTMPLETAVPSQGTHEEGGGDRRGRTAAPPGRNGARRASPSTARQRRPTSP